MTNLPPGDEAIFFAEQKARSVTELYPNALILGCDTLIACDDEKLGKPRDADDAYRILFQLAGRSHRVLTAVVLIDSTKGSIRRHLESAEVGFKRLSESEIRGYIATGEPMGKAGGYAIQGMARKLLIESVEGDEEAVIGLPLRIVRGWLSSIDFSSS